MSSFWMQAPVFEAGVAGPAAPQVQVAEPESDDLRSLRPGRVQTPVEQRLGVPAPPGAAGDAEDGDRHGPLPLALDSSGHGAPQLVAGVQVVRLGHVPHVERVDHVQPQRPQLGVHLLDGSPAPAVRAVRPGDAVLGLQTLDVGEEARPRWGTCCC